MTISLHDLHDVLLPISSIEESRFKFKLCPYGRDDEISLSEDEHGNIHCILQFVRGELSEDGEYLICDLLEQRVMFVSHEHRDHPHICTHYIDAWVHVLRQAFRDDIDASDGKPILDRTMPYELVFPKVLSLKRPKTFDDFVRAFQVKSRLGKFLQV